MTAHPTPPPADTSLIEVVLAIADLGRGHTVEGIDRPGTVSRVPVAFTRPIDESPDPLIELLTEIGRLGSGSNSAPKALTTPPAVVPWSP